MSAWPHREALLKVWPDLAAILVARPPALLLAALRCCATVYRVAPAQVPSEVDGQVCIALNAILEETSPTSAEPSYDRHAARYLAATLAAAMQRSGRGDTRNINGWASASVRDPLPDVRNAFDDVVDRGGGAGSLDAASDGGPLQGSDLATTTLG